ncbi:hypothetical protein E1B28_010939 [Marasmius oreades]|uniref:Uncharacterized protein n=1 Tax=Marasmius oreades TaxID=181124 RepID=A0A9P7UPP4_9AGAR|nr:uncharacterized protein E1B28_010939 [Marasmius oreades]KAG7089240.1 hypothetical protein E1B28_010939 [Marasmius oreades]
MAKMSTPREMTDEELKILMSNFSAIVRVSNEAAEREKLKMLNEAECCLAFDDIVGFIFSDSKEGLLRLEKAVPLPRNLIEDLFQAGSEDEASVQVTDVPSSLDTLLYFSTVPEIVFPSSTDTFQQSLQNKVHEYLTNTLKSVHTDITLNQQYLREALDIWESKQNRNDVLECAYTDFNAAICDAVVSVQPCADSLPPDLVQDLRFFAAGRDLEDGILQEEIPLIYERTQINHPERIAMDKYIVDLVEEIKKMSPDASWLPETTSTMENLTKFSVHTDQQGSSSQQDSTIRSDNFASVLNLPFLFFEYKVFDVPCGGVHQASFHLTSAIQYLAMLGIYNFWVFAVATTGHTARLLSACGEVPTEKSRSSLNDS